MLAGCSKHHIQGDIARGWEEPQVQHVAPTTQPMYHTYPPLLPRPRMNPTLLDPIGGIIVGPNPGDTWVDLGGGIVVGPRGQTFLDLRPGRLY
jgi:hypothetical protein